MLKELPPLAMSLHISLVILWGNGQVMVIDQQGNQMPEYQGGFEQVGKRINDIYKGEWCLGDWNTGSFSLSSYSELKQARSKMLSDDIPSWDELPSLDEQGFIKQRRLTDGRLLAVDPLLYGRARLGISPLPPLEDAEWFADTWEYPTVSAALHALETWKPEETSEPDGWDKHPISGRHRIGGKEGLEYIKGDGKPIGQARFAIGSTYGQEWHATSIEEKPLAGLEGTLPSGTTCFLALIESTHCQHTPKCRYRSLVYHHLDRCVVIAERGKGGFVMEARNLWRRLCE